jgi:hypothetical protein
MHVTIRDGIEIARREEIVDRLYENQANRDNFGGKGIEAFMAICRLYHNSLDF